MKEEISRRLSIQITTEGLEFGDPVKQDLLQYKIEDEDEDDYLTRTIGIFGLWQAAVYVTVSLTRVIAMWNMMSFFFVTPAIEFVCVEFSDNVTTEVINSTCYDNCVKYKYLSVLGRSVIEDFGLICQNAWLPSFIQSTLMMGLLVGASLFGWISDRFGRRTALLLSTFLNTVFLIILPISSTIIIFTCIRFMIGVATGGSLFICVVLIMEITGKSQREIAAACILIPDGVAQASLAAFAYFTSDWQKFTLSYGIVAGFIFILTLFVPESPRWLVSNGKLDEAVKVITCAAIRNKLDTSNIEAEITKALEDIKLKDYKMNKPSYLQFFKSKALFIVTLVIFILWLTMGVCYYGINQYVVITGVNPYLTVVILGLIQFPSVPMSVIVNQRFGRRIATIGTTVGTGVVTLIVIFMPKGHWFVTMFSVVALIFNNIFIIIAYIHLSELYPTFLRNMSIAMASTGAKIGAMIAPFIATLSPTWLPSLVFCIFSIIGGLCCLLLPETKGQNLKDTIEK